MLEEHRLLRERISKNMGSINIDHPKPALLNLFSDLGYNTRNNPDLTTPTFNGILPIFDDPNAQIDPQAFHASEWKYVNIIFQFSQVELQNQLRLFEQYEISTKEQSAFVFLAISLRQPNYSRSTLSRISREINKKFTIPVICLFLYGDYLTITYVNKRKSKRKTNSIITEKVILIKDINTKSPKRGHIEILAGLSLRAIKSRASISGFDEFSKLWRAALDVKLLSNKFYRDLKRWKSETIEAITKSIQPHASLHEEDAKTIEHGVIVFVIECIFLWFLREMEIIPSYIFDKDNLPRQLFNIKLGNEATNYTATIFHNILHSALSQPIDHRKPQILVPLFGSIGPAKTSNPTQQQSDALQNLFSEVPFISSDLSFTLFGKGTTTFLNTQLIKQTFDGIIIPNHMVLSGVQKDIDLSTTLIETKPRPLFSILDRYKFTVAENTPLEIEVALDPEFLGNIYQKLLQSDNSTFEPISRQVTGAYYTPKEIVDLSLRLSILELLKQQDLLDQSRLGTLERHLETFTNQLEFSADEKDKILYTLEKQKVLDPSCGTGAFLMGYSDFLINLSNSFGVRRNLSDYKEALIQKSLFGLDLNSVAILITKLRFILYICLDRDYKSVDARHQNKPICSFEDRFMLTDTLQKKEDSESNNTYDLICGNPPWGLPNHDQRTRLREMYPETDTKIGNYSAYFLSWAWRHKNAVVAMVIPDVIITKSYPNTQQILKKLASEIIWVENSTIPSSIKHFEETSMDFAVIITTPTPMTTIRYQTIAASKDHAEFEISRFDINRSSLSQVKGNIASLIRLAPEYQKIFELIERFPTLEENFQVHEGVHSGNARKELFLYPKEENSDLPTIIVGAKSKDYVSKFYCNPLGWKLNRGLQSFKRTQYLRFQLGNERWHVGPKILIQRTGRPITAFFDKGNYFSNNFLAILAKDDRLIDDEQLHSLLPFLNSPITSFYISRYLAPRIGGAFIETKSKHIRQLPTPFEFPERELFAIISKEIAQKKGEGINTIMLEKLANALVYEVFFPDSVHKECGSFFSLTMEAAKFNASGKNEKGYHDLGEIMGELNNPISNLRKSMSQLILVPEVKLIEFA